MASFELYSKRQKKIEGRLPQIFTFNELPQPFRVQVVHIIRDAIGRVNENFRVTSSRLIEESFEEINNVLCREFGVFCLVRGEGGYQHDVIEFLLGTSDVENALDVIELCFKYINKVIPKIHNDSTERSCYVEIRVAPQEAIEELNVRFREHGIGFQYSIEADQIIRIDSTYVYSEIVQPALQLLFSKKFRGACEEYLNAHEHYKHSRNKECINDCLKTFESIVKTICKNKDWPFNDKDTASALVKVLYENKFIPDYMQAEFTSLRSLLESGIAPIRNRLGGHGQGEEQIRVSDTLTRYALNLTGSTVIFLIEQSGL